MCHVTRGWVQTVSSAEKTDHLREQKSLIDGVLASKKVLVTLTGNCKGSRQAARHAGSTAPAGDAKSFLSFEIACLSLMVLAKGLLKAAESSREVVQWFLDPSDDLMKQGNGVKAVTVYLLIL